MCISKGISECVYSTRISSAAKNPNRSGKRPAKNVAKANSSTVAGVRGNGGPAPVASLKRCERDRLRRDCGEVVSVVVDAGGL